MGFVLKMKTVWRVCIVTISNVLAIVALTGIAIHQVVVFGIKSSPSLILNICKPFIFYYSK